MYIMYCIFNSGFGCTLFEFYLIYNTELFSTSGDSHLWNIA